MDTVNEDLIDWLKQIRNYEDGKRCEITSEQLRQLEADGLARWSNFAGPSLTTAGRKALAKGGSTDADNR